MAALDQGILLAATLLVASIFAGLVSSRFGAPLLLVFLVLGMLAGEDGPGGISFDDFEAAYVIGATALAVILFDGGLRTRLDSFRRALAPSFVLATVGVVATAGLTALAARLVLVDGWIEALLVGSIVASTDAAAVFFLLRLRGLRLHQRVGGVLEVESGLNDPMAVFLTLTCVGILQAGETAGVGDLALGFAVQMIGGGAIGLGAGYVLVWLINRVELAPGLYPILAIGAALMAFAGAQTAGASGFLAVYLTGLVVGVRRHRAALLIERFQDGLAWLAQIGMFLMLGLLVTPSELLDDLGAALFVAFALMLFARPASVASCLLPFRFAKREIAFVSWVGLRGAVPIFLGAIPVLAGLPNADAYFHVAFVVVLSSLVLQGWTTPAATRRLGLELPPAPPPPRRADVDLGVGGEGDRQLTVYAVDPASPAAKRSLRRLGAPTDVTFVSVIRDGATLDPAGVLGFQGGDAVLALVPPEGTDALDRLFAPEPKPSRDEGALGEFAFAGSTPLGAFAAFYGVDASPEDAELSLGAFVAARLPGRPFVGDRLRLGGIELIVRAMEAGAITQVGLELEPREVQAPRWMRLAWSWIRARASRLRRAAR